MARLVLTFTRYVTGECLRYRVDRNGAAEAAAAEEANTGSSWWRGVTRASGALNDRRVRSQTEDRSRNRAC